MFMEAELSNGDAHKTVTAMIIDDRKLVRDGMKMILEGSGDFEVVAGADDVKSSIRYARGHHPDIAVVGPFVLEQALTDNESFQALVQGMHEAAPETNILMVAARRDIRRLTSGLEAGARGIVEMSAPSDEFVHAARVVAHGEAHLPPGIALEMVRLGRNDDAGGLNEREEQMLSEIGLGYTNSEIADHMHLSVRTVESHRARMQTKLGVSSRAGLVREALDRGLVH